MWKYALATILGLCLAPAAMAQNYATYFNFHGKVKDQWGNPYAGKTVRVVFTLWDGNGNYFDDATYSVLTDVDGSYNCQYETPGVLDAVLTCSVTMVGPYSCISGNGYWDDSLGGGGIDYVNLYDAVMKYVPPGGGG